MNPSRVAVVAMGDLARSPRMINHARELAANGFSTVMIGYRGHPFEPPPGVRVVFLDGGKGAPPGSSGMAFALTAGWRMSRLFAALIATLLREKPRAILVQDPPSFPTLTAARLAAGWLGASVIVDWQNYGYSLLALRLGESHWLVRCARRYEFSAGRRATRHLCVSRAMRDDLARRGIPAAVLYDSPLSVSPGRPEASRGRPEASRGLLAVCPAGWTADEDMELLLDALESLPATPIVVYITGNGFKRTELAARLQALRARGILVDTGFIPVAEYWDLIRKADLGLSLHRSSSGLDLAMKVVDLFSAQVPVCALDYGGSISEQIEEGVTGFLFRTAAELAALLGRLSSNSDALSAMRCSVAERHPPSWSEDWKSAVLPVLEDSK